ncbi:uncharacterized protein E0L32_006081 [Thyridium curvatum]|uniref:Uncharacterized protein n=1 Tax=Thyridium curvatum TaxID=1093900 RepID=A0A507BAJ8_9PEZI|nr:uncharacterized protein E0L32_006081 [Thyridium curvatum]TPX13610.1 hypothetical protein E0L32_006081 [Thyridium curvatum]
MNDQLFRPRGLYCLIMAYDVNSYRSVTQQDTTTDLDAMVPGSHRSDQGTRHKIRSNDGVTGVANFPAAAELIFPDPNDTLPDSDDDQESDDEDGKGNGNGFLGKLGKFAADMNAKRDLRSQVKFQRKNPTSAINSLLDPKAGLSEKDLRKQDKREVKQERKRDKAERKAEKRQRKHPERSPKEPKMKPLLFKVRDGDVAVAVCTVEQHLPRMAALYLVAQETAPPETRIPPQRHSLVLPGRRTDATRDARAETRMQTAFQCRSHMQRGAAIAPPGTMATNTDPSGSGLRPVTDQIYVSHPSDPSDAAAADGGPSRNDDPTAILIHGWGGASAKSISGHAAGYRKLYPGAKIVVVLSTPTLYLFRSYDACVRAMRRVVDEIFPTAENSKENEQPRLLVHVLSNTGLYFYSATLTAYRQRFGPGAKLPHPLLALDSAPGGSDFSANVGRWTQATAIGLQRVSPLPYFATEKVCSLFWHANRTLELATGRENMHAIGPRVVNDADLESTDAMRLYLYSKEDALMGWEDIEKHGQEAEEKGYKTTRVMFAGSSHVSHMRAHPDKYWEAVSRSWSQAIEAQSTSAEPTEEGRLKARL